MKNLISIVAFFTCFAACKNQDTKTRDLLALSKDTANFTTIKWIDSLKDIGAVATGKKAEIKFRFKNTGNKPLFIISAEPGCGCTLADYPKEAIAPGSEGLITANYDVHSGNTGEFRKNIHVTTNTKASTSHYIFFYGVIKNEGDTVAAKKIDTATLKAIQLKELKRNFLLKPTKN